MKYGQDIRAPSAQLQPHQYSQQCFRITPDITPEITLPQTAHGLYERATIASEGFNIQLDHTSGGMAGTSVPVVSGVA